MVESEEAMPKSTNQKDLIFIEETSIFLNVLYLV